MPRLLYLTVVLVSIICCSLLSSATPEGTKLVQLEKGQLEETLALSKSRDIREAGNRKKMENGQNEDSDKRQKKGRNGSKRKYSRRAKDSKKTNKRQTGQRRKKSPKRRRQRSKQKKNGGRKSKHNGKNGTKKQKNQTERNGRNDAEKDSRQSLTVNCVQELNKFAKTGPTNLRTMYRKGIRAERFNVDIWRKLGKCGTFYRPYYYLRRMLSVNSFPWCTNPTDELKHLSVLQNCHTEIETHCKPVLTSFFDFLNIYTCTKVFDTLRDNVFTKLKGDTASADDMCKTVDAFPAIMKIEYNKIQTCNNDMNTFEKDTSNQKKKCFKAFTACRKAEREVPRLDAKCRWRIDPRAIVTWNEFVIFIWELWLNFKCIISQITSFPWPIPPGTGSGRQLLNKRQKRQIEETEDLACLEILDAWKTFNVSAVAATDSVSGPTDFDAADQAISALQSILNRENFTDDIISCANATDNSVFVEISDYMTWAFIWTVEVVEPKIEMLTALQDNETTCSTPTTISTVESTNPTSTSTSTTSVANSSAASSSTPTVANSTAASSSAPNVANSNATSSSIIQTLPNQSTLLQP